ncbi:hypothetical protein ACFWEH_12950 [Streptomyces anulatus]|uniref:hypothetical protein n=1 Tax=Streptomyces TaxID=1883 RepID=UPI00093E764F|nr:hypothetical protein [Streptomyces sp. TSRI0395]OKI83777.1 hypothetical protein AMK12_11685 [Streptomyces sp. TSRI0395]
MRTTHALTTATVTALLALTGCSSEPEPYTPAGPGKYEQTWTTPYSSTTCGDYLNTLNQHQRWVLAADMLSGARKADGTSTLPDDTDVDRFQQDMANACKAEATAKTTEVGATLYTLDPTYKP